MFDSDRFTPGVAIGAGVCNLGCAVHVVIIGGAGILRPIPAVSCSGVESPAPADVTATWPSPFWSDSCSQLASSMGGLLETLLSTYSVFASYAVTDCYVLASHRDMFANRCAIFVCSWFIDLRFTSCVRCRKWQACEMFVLFILCVDFLLWFVHLDVCLKLQMFLLDFQQILLCFDVYFLLFGFSFKC